jgi:hypothetical protein
MWSMKVSRKELAEILNSARPSLPENLYSLQANLSPLGSSNGIELLWRYDPAAGGRQLPSAIIVDQQDQKDFLAWMNTYVPSIRPLTAYSRVSDRQTALYFLGLHTSPSLGRLEGACLGVIIGETLTYVGKSRDLGSITHAACLSTLAFAISRAAGIGLERGFISEVETRWSRARDLLGSSSLPIDARAVKAALSVVGHLSEGRIDLPAWQPPSEVVLECCSQILSSGEIRHEDLEFLGRDVREFVNLRSELNRPREERLSLFEQAIHAISRSEIKGDFTAEFLCGYLASAISPGTLDHIHVVLPYIRTFPTLIIWYGLCAGLSSKDNLSAGLNGLVRRVQRELFREDDFLRTPSCDISFAELQLVSKSAREWTDIRTSAAGQFVVELLPSINSHYRLPRAEGAVETPSSETLSAINELRGVLDRAKESINRFQRVAGQTSAEAWELERARKRKSGK